jgi:cap1 methyltransferase
MEGKRRRSESSSRQRKSYEHERDVYNEAIDPTASASRNSSVKSSWFRSIEYFRQEKAIAAGVPTDDSLVKSEIISISKQLSQVKRRLSPAAERCTEAMNSFYNDCATTGRQEFAAARRACNPYEVLGEGRNGGLNSMFINRSAIKLANIDAVLRFDLSRPGKNGQFSFVDLCAAPGGFSEYLGKRCHANAVPECRGYGMSLLSTNEYGEATKWKMDDSTSTENGTYAQYRVCEGSDGTGDILKWENIEALHNMVRDDISAVARVESSVEWGKVDLVVADGGFDAQRDSDHQEAISQKLVVCEIAAGLLLLKKGGKLMVKMFGFQTEIIRSVMEDLAFTFEEIIALKPISSRPASAERYVVFRGFKGNPADWEGQRWIDRMFLGKNSTQCARNRLQQPNCTNRLGVYLDAFDRDLLSLNLKTCFSILSFLENKCRAIHSQQRAGPDSDSQEATLVDVEAFKAAWNLQ